MPTSKTAERSTTVSELLERVATIAPQLRMGARESEDGRRLTDASVRALHEQGFYKMWWPAELGGAGADLVDGMSIIDALAAVEPAAAWNLAVGTTHDGFAGAYLETHAVDVIFAQERLVIAGQMAPIGQAARVDGGLRVTGRWSFGSGIHQASWVLGGATLKDGDASQPIVVVVPVGKATIDDESWEVIGLSGTGSCDYTLDDVFVPEGYWFAFPAPRRLRGGPVFDLPVPAHAMILHSGFAVGAARGSLAAIEELARTKVRGFTKGTVAQSTTFQRELAEAHVKVAAARLYVYDVARRIQEAVGQPELGKLLLEGRASSRYATDVALDVATWAYRRGGGTSLRLNNPLQRTLRDLLAASQHVFVEDSAYVTMGASMIGIES